MIYINVHRDENHRPYTDVFSDQTTAIEEVHVPGLTYLHTIENDGENLAMVDYEPLVEQLYLDREADRRAEQVERSAYMAGAV